MDDVVRRQIPAGPDDVVPAGPRRATPSAPPQPPAPCIASRPLEHDRRGRTVSITQLLGHHKRWLSLQTTTGGPTSGIALHALGGSCSIDESPNQWQQLLRVQLAREGQSRVPEPPERITGINMMARESLRPNSQSSRRSRAAITHFVPIRRRYASGITHPGILTSLHDSSTSSHPRSSP